MGHTLSVSQEIQFPIESRPQTTSDWVDAFARLFAGRRVALVHDWLVTYAGSERVVEQMLSAMPQVDLFTLFDFVPEAERGFLQGKTPRTSFLQNVPLGRKFHRAMLPLMPLAVESFDLREYDVVITSSHAISKGVLPVPGQLHICYCNTPMRYAWDLQNQYLRESSWMGKVSTALARVLLHYLRMWDVRTANSVDVFVANSSYIAERILKTYRRQSLVINPPVDTGYFHPGPERGDFYLTASRMVPYKRVPLIVEAFSKMPDRKLVVFGTGPEEARCHQLAGPNVTFVGHAPSGALREAMQRAKAFVFAAEEDFGIVMAEAQACGTPVICYSAGGARDIVEPGRTGTFFYKQTPDAVTGAVREFEAGGDKYDSSVIRRSAERFSPDCFKARLYGVIAQGLAGAYRGQPAEGALARRH